MRQRSWLAPAIVFVVALAVYLRTAPPGLTWAHDSADGGDLIAAALVRGVPHPSGYPTFILLAHLFTRLPWHTPAWQVTLISMLSGAGRFGQMLFQRLRAGRGHVAVDLQDRDRVAGHLLRGRPFLDLAVRVERPLHQPHLARRRDEEIGQDRQQHAKEHRLLQRDDQRECQRGHHHDARDPPRGPHIGDSFLLDRLIAGDDQQRSHS